MRMLLGVLIGAGLVIALVTSSGGSSDGGPGVFQHSLEKSEVEERQTAKREAHLSSAQCDDGGVPQVCGIAGSVFGAKYVEQVTVAPDPENPGKKVITYGFRLPGMEPAYAVALGMKSEAVDAFRRTYKLVPRSTISYVEVGAYTPEGRRVFDAAVRADEVHGDPLNAMQIGQIDPSLEEP
jgi:hypothetical protein